jgi:ketosteroid isomerase-like protein
MAPGGSVAGGQDRLADLRRQVADTERAFAKTMADRDYAAFQTFLASDVIFLGERTGPQRGKARVAEAWKYYYEPVAAPFSWRPEVVEVLESGTLALSSGPVFDPAGNQVGTYNSIWRLEADGKWRVIFDKGCPPCKC